jgi:hypothetical protein
MKVRMLVSIAGVEFSFAAGQDVDLPDDQAKAMIACGHATAIHRTTSSKAAAALHQARERSRPRGARKGSK